MQKQLFNTENKLSVQIVKYDAIKHYFLNNHYMKKITLRQDENLFIMSDKQVNDLKRGLLILITNLDEAFEKSGKKSSDKALADSMERIVDKLV